MKKQDGSTHHELPSLVANPNPSIYLSGRYVVLDYETSSKDKGSPYNLANKLVLACWYTSWDNTWHHKWGEEYEQQELLKDIASADFLVAQNAKFELGWLDRCGIDLHDLLVFDTYLAGWVLGGNLLLRENLSLQRQLKARGLEGKEDVVAGMIKLGIDPENIPRPLLLEYCYEDIRGTLELFLEQREELAEREQLHLLYSRCLLTPVLVDIEKQGIHLDKDAVEQEYHRVEEAIQECDKALSEFGAINWNSPKQKASLIYDTLGFQELTFRGKPQRTPAGGRQTDEATLSKLKAKNKKQESFLALLRERADLQAKLSKSLKFFKTVCDEYNGIFYGELNQGTTQTHRLSSSGRKVSNSLDGESYGAQLQNLPRGYKRFVSARESGWIVLEADGSQIEFRVAADMGKDRVAYKEIVNHDDIHSYTKEALAENGKEVDRQGAKEFTFKPLYGGSRGDHPAIEAYCEFFKNKYRGISERQLSWTHQVLRDKFLRTPYGMMFYWPDTQLSKTGYITNTTSIYNYPVQGFATGEIIPIVLVCLWHRLRTWNVRFILTVHDSIIMEVGPDVDMEALKQVIATCFTEDVYNYLELCYNYTFVVPLGCSMKWGKYWGDGKEIKADMLNKDRKLQWY